MGRPPIITGEVVKLLEDAFKLDAPVTEACQYAGISRTAYYDYIKAHPEFLDRLERLKSMTRFKIRGKVISRALKDPNFGLNYLKLKCDDFKEKKQVDAEVNTKLNAADSLIIALGKRSEEREGAENGEA
jgi:predicted DNA-binding protein YlxM (UPF0122 family)